MRRSLFGYFCRRCFLSFLKLSFTGVVKIQHDYQAWCKGDRNAGYGFVEKDQLDHCQYISHLHTLRHLSAPQRVNSYSERLETTKCMPNRQCMMRE